MFRPSKALIDDLTSSPGDVTIAQHLAILCGILGSLAKDENALAKPPVGASEWEVEFSAHIVALQKEHQLSKEDLMNLLAVAIYSITRLQSLNR